MVQGPEDSPAWAKDFNLSKTNNGTDCLNCGIEIVVAHCPNGGCPWCASCGDANKPKEK